MNTARRATLDYRNVYRAHVAHMVGEAEYTCFVYATSRQAAIQRIARVGYPDDCIYNCCHAHELVQQGVSEDLELRLFEVAWVGEDKVLAFCEHPIFLVPRPGDWARKWAAAMELSDRATAAQALRFRASYVRAVGHAFGGDDVDRAGIEDRAAHYEAVAARMAG